jgi:hypothetical protein
MEASDQWCRLLGSLFGNLSGKAGDMFGGSDDTTNIHPGQGPNSYDGPRGWM